MNIVQKDRMASRLAALAATFAKTDRILTGNRSITVRVSTTAKTKVSAPGFSDGKNITINADTFKNIGSAVSLVRLLGLNYHELSHIMFTPRTTTHLRNKIAVEKMNRAFNVLEDQRIETLFSATYKPAGKYFTEMVVEFFVDREETWSQAHLFTHGRRYLPLEIREEFSKRFAGSKSDKERAEEIIEEYRLLDLYDPNSVMTQKVLELVREFHYIMNRAAAAAGEDSPNPAGADENGSEGCGSPKEGQPEKGASKSASRSARDQAAEQDEVEEEGEDGSGFWDEFDEEEDSDDDSDEDEDGDGEEDDSDWEGDSTSSDDDTEDDDDAEDGDGGADESGDVEDGADDDDVSDSDSGGDSDEDEGEEADGSDPGDSDGPSDSDSHSNEHGDSDTDPDGVDDEETRDILKDVLNAVMDSEQVRGDIRRLNNAINDPGALDVDGDNRQTQAGQEPPTPVMSSTLREVQREFRRLWAQVEPGWKYGSDEGRLNVQRAMSSEDYEDVFDEWDEGREQASGLEVFIALDTSGSMSGQEIHDASAALWIIKRACDELDASVSCVSFGAVTKTVYQREEKADRSSVTFFAANGADTRPGQSLRIGRRILTQSDKANKLFIVITDGGWSTTNGEHPDGVVAENLGELVQTIPATTLFIGVGHGGSSNTYSQYFDVAKGVSHTSEIAPLIKTAITTMLRTRVNTR